MNEKRDKPSYCYESGCPMSTKGRGFALGCGDVSSPISILFERPAEDELAFVLDTKTKPEGMSIETWAHVRVWREKEITRRKEAYPELDLRWILRGAPVRGASGAELSGWAFKMAGGGLNLEECFLENVLHCAAPSGADEKNMYPKGDERTRAESCCAHWNRLLPRIQNLGTAAKVAEVTATEILRVNVGIVSLHPAGLLKEKGGGIVSLPLQADTFRKARSFVRLGKRVLVLAGGKAAKWWLGYAESVTKWCGHYAEESEETWSRRLKRIQEGLSIKLTASGRKLRKSSTAESTPSSSTEKKSKRTRRKKPDLTGMEAFNA